MGRNKHRIEVHGESLTYDEAAEKYNLTPEAIYRRVHAGHTPEESVMPTTLTRYSVHGEMLTIPEMCKKYSVRDHTIYRRFREGRTPEEAVLRGRLPYRGTRRRVWDEKRMADVQVMIDEGATLREIGERYGVTRERARQALAANGLKTKNVAGQREGWLSMTDFALELQVTISTLKGMMEQFEGADFMRRVGSHRLISVSAIPVFAAARFRLRSGRCMECGAEIQGGETGPVPRRCSEECRKIDNRRRANNYYHQKILGKTDYACPY